MIPKILDYEDERIKVTAEAYMISEIKAILDKYELKAEPYLAYVHLMTHPQSPFVNFPEEDKKESVIYEITQTIGDFDIDDELLEPAIQKFEKLYESPLVLMAKEMDEELHRLRKYLRNTEINSENMRDRTAFVKDIEKIVGSYTKVKEQADKEIEVKMRGQASLGDY